MFFLAQNGLVSLMLPSHIETTHLQQFKYRKSFLSRYQKSHFTTAPSFLLIFLHNNLSWISLSLFFFLILSDQNKLSCVWPPGQMFDTFIVVCHNEVNEIFRTLLTILVTTTPKIKQKTSPFWHCQQKLKMSALHQSTIELDCTSISWAKLN